MSKKAVPKSKVKVLYQNLGGIWYAFAEQNEEVYFGRVPLHSSAEEAFLLLKGQPTRKTLRQKASSNPSNSKRKSGTYTKKNGLKEAA